MKNKTDYFSKTCSLKERFEKDKMKKTKKFIFSIGLCTPLCSMLLCANAPSKASSVATVATGEYVAGFDLNKIKVPTYTKTKDNIYTKDNVHIRYKPNKKSKSLIVAKPHTKLKRVADGIKGWDKIRIDGKVYFVADDYITTKVPKKKANPIVKQIKDNTIDSSDLRLMSSIIFAEAGNQCYAGQQAVGIVVMNRTTSNQFKYAKNIHDVIYAPGQFTPARNGALNRALALYDRGRLPKSCIAAAKYALSGGKTVNYNGRAYNMSSYLFFSGWVSNCRLRIQGHMFK